MKLFHKLSLLMLLVAFAACEKADKLPLYGDGVATVLTAASTTIAPIPADSGKYSLILNWTDPKYAQSPSLYKFVIEIDSTTRNFSKAYTRTVIGKLTDSVVAKELNSAMLAWGFAFNTAYDLDVRVTASYGNNNELKRSNILKIKATPYKVPPKVALPALGKLFIVGGGTDGGWNNPVPVPSQELARIDETTFGGIFNFKANDAYVLLPSNGSWDTKFVIDDRNLPGVDTIGKFFFSTGPGQDFKTPATAGLYKITVDFQQGTYKVVPFTQQHGLPSTLWVVGDAFTPGIPAWTNGNPMPAGTQFTRRNSTEFDITVAMKGGGEYLILPNGLGNWDKYAITNKGAAGASAGGKFLPEASDNFPGPTAAGTYKISINLFNNTYKVQ